MPLWYTTGWFGLWEISEIGKVQVIFFPGLQKKLAWVSKNFIEECSMSHRRTYYILEWITGQRHKSPHSLLSSACEHSRGCMFDGKWREGVGKQQQSSESENKSISDCFTVVMFWSNNANDHNSAQSCNEVQQLWIDWIDWSEFRQNTHLTQTCLPLLVHLDLDRAEGMKTEMSPEPCHF